MGPITIRGAAATLAVILALAGGLAAQAQTRPISILAAMTTAPALDIIAAQWARRTGKPVPTIVYDRSAGLVDKLAAGAAADLIFTGSLESLDAAAAKGLIKADSRATLLSNPLALMAAAGHVPALKIGPGFDLLGALGTGKLAVPPETGLPGKTARASLKALGVWDKVADRVVIVDGGENAVANAVAAGKARLGFVFLADVSENKAVTPAAIFADQDAPPVLYPLALTARSDNPDAADFLRALESPAARAVFEAQGFRVPTASARQHR